MKQHTQNNTEAMPDKIKVFIKLKDKRNGWAIYHTNGKECAVGFSSYEAAEDHAKMYEMEIVANPEAIQDKGNGHTPGKVHLASELKGDEYTVNILSEEGYLLAQANTNLYFPYDNAEANAARIVECWNNYDELISENENVTKMLYDEMEKSGHITKVALDHEKELENKEDTIKELHDFLSKIIGSESLARIERFDLLEEAQKLFQITAEKQ